ncbi:hypothetical protein FNAPI_13938, partial [Fusarium napiforme]
GRNCAQNAPHFGDKIIALHRKYGPLVRIGPNLVSVSDPAAIPTIYGNKHVWKKASLVSPSPAPSSQFSANHYHVQASSSGAATPIYGGQAIPSVITMSEASHTSIRRAVRRTFTTSELLEYEAFIDETAETLVKWSTALPSLISWASSGIMAAAMKRFDHWNTWAALPNLEYLLIKSPLARWRSKDDSSLAKVSRQKLASRNRAEFPHGTSADLLQKLLAGQSKHADRVTDNEMLGVVMSIISAGADTTASTFVAIFYFLMRHPPVLAMLRAEIDNALRDGTLSDPPRWKQVYQLPYLEAIIKETMRYWPPFAFGLDRVIPEGGALIAGTMLPAGVEVGAHVEAVHRDYTVYGDDADIFRPERWTEASEAQRALMDRSFLSFSTGKRVCLGLHIAYRELKKVVPLLLMKFDVTMRANEQDLLGGAWVTGVKYPPPIFMTFK